MLLRRGSSPGRGAENEEDGREEGDDRFEVGEAERERECSK